MTEPARPARRHAQQARQPVAGLPHRRPHALGLRQCRRQRVTGTALTKNLVSKQSVRVATGAAAHRHERHADFARPVGRRGYTSHSNSIVTPMPLQLLVHLGKARWPCHDARATSQSKLLSRAPEVSSQIRTLPERRTSCDAYLSMISRMSLRSLHELLEVLCGPPRPPSGRQPCPLLPPQGSAIDRAALTPPSAPLCLPPQSPSVLNTPSAKLYKLSL